MPSAPSETFLTTFLRSRLTVEEDGNRLVLHHFARDPFGVVFGTLWLCGWMVGIVLLAGGAAWHVRGVLIAGGMIGIWLLAGYAVLAALVQHDELIVTPDAICYR